MEIRNFNFKLKLKLKLNKVLENNWKGVKLNIISKADKFTKEKQFREREREKK